MLCLNQENYSEITCEKFDDTNRLPVKILQFGEGNFLRGFVDWMIDRMNEKGLFNGRITVVQPIKTGLVPLINEQDGLYTMLLRGISDSKIQEEQKIISAIKNGINPYTDYEGYLALADNQELRFIISNTTEAGIAYLGTDTPADSPPASFPGKLTNLLYRRFRTFHGASDKGFVIIPCELIDRNGDSLKKIVLQLAEEWEYGQAFIEWINKSNYFLNTLVDRIVTGYPRNELETLTKEMGYTDKLLNTAEIFHLWVIEGDKRFSEELPFEKAGLNVIWTDDMTPYRTRKVRILNGAHTMTVLAAYLYGLKTVKQCTEDETILRLMRKGIFEEIIPTLDLPQEELVSFADSVLERFANPFIQHYLMSIALNSVSKFKVRVLPSLLGYTEKMKKLPEVLCFSFAALIAFYKGDEISGNALIGNLHGESYSIIDDMDCLTFFQKVWKKCKGSPESFMALTKSVLAQEYFWGQDLSGIPGLLEVVSGYLSDIHNRGIQAVIADLISSESRWQHAKSLHKNQQTG